MKKRKNNTVTLLIAILVVLLVLVFLFNNNIINFKSNKKTNDLSNNDNSISVDKLSQYGEANDRIITEETAGDYTFKIDKNGDIIINAKHKISNISQAKSIKIFSPPSPYSTLYILTEDGDIYQYETSNYEQGNYNATKINDYNNIKQIITYTKRSSEGMGGCDYIIIKDNNEKYYELNSFCI